MDRTSRRPGDTFRPPQAWQLDAGPVDGRWGVQADRYEYMNGQCRYCGSYCQGPANSVTAHPRASCLACGTPQCATPGFCLVCLAGFVGKPPWNVTRCGYKQCDRPAVAKAPRIRVVCLADLGKATALIRGARIPLADVLAARLAQRDRGGQDWQRLTWFGPRKRYAVRRWHDDGRTGWTTGEGWGFETAGQADREAEAWNDPATSDGWHAQRVELTDEVRALITEWEKTC